MLVTRIAPTPSGYLHPGNAVNFLLTSWLARSTGGRLLLRIDDMDATRVRDEYTADIFRVLAWLGILIDQGPSDVEEFRREYSQARRTEHYRGELDRLPGLYACRCSRRELPAGGSYPGTCRGLGLAWEPGTTALRIEVPPGTAAVVGELTIDVAEEVGDFVVWRRDDLPSYQLASVIEDRDLGVNAVVRGMDLLPSTAAQLYLAPWLGAQEFVRADFRHHALLRDGLGLRMSKSAGSRGASMVGDPGLLRWIWEQARELAPTIGVVVPG